MIHVFMLYIVELCLSFFGVWWVLKQQWCCMPTYTNLVLIKCKANKKGTQFVDEFLICKLENWCWSKSTMGSTKSKHTILLWNGGWIPNLIFAVIDMSHIFYLLKKCWVSMQEAMHLFFGLSTDIVCALGKLSFIS